MSLPLTATLSELNEVRQLVENNQKLSPAQDAIWKRVNDVQASIDQLQLKLEHQPGILPHILLDETQCRRLLDAGIIPTSVQQSLQRLPVANQCAAMTNLVDHLHRLQKQLEHDGVLCGANWQDSPQGSDPYYNFVTPILAQCGVLSTATAFPNVGFGHHFAIFLKNWGLLIESIQAPVKPMYLFVDCKPTRPLCTTHQRTEIRMSALKLFSWHPGRFLRGRLNALSPRGDLGMVFEVSGQSTLIYCSFILPPPVFGDYIVEVYDPYCCIDYSGQVQVRVDCPRDIRILPVVASTEPSWCAKKSQGDQLIHTDALAALRNYEAAVESFPGKTDLATILSNASQVYLTLEDSIGALCCAAAALVVDPASEKACSRYKSALKSFRSLTPSATAAEHLTKCVTWVASASMIVPREGGCEELRLQGNAAYGRRDFAEAISCYFAALSNYEDFTKLLSNMNMACQRLYLLEESLALNNAIALILRSKGSGHALRIKNYKRALYAMLHLRLQIEVDDNDKESLKLRKETYFDFGDCNLRDVRPDQLAEFVHPQLQVQSVLGKGRGLILGLGASVPAGEVLLCSRAALVSGVDPCYMAIGRDEAIDFRGIPHRHNRTLSVATREVQQHFSLRGFSRLQRVYFQLRGFPVVTGRTAPDTFMDLRPRLDYPMMYELPLEAELTPFDLGHAVEIISENEFHLNVTLRHLTPTSQEGLFLNPSLMNHDDFPNTQRFFCDNWMLVVATEDLAAGTEITTTYGQKAQQGPFQLLRWPFLAAIDDPTDLKSYLQWKGSLQAATHPNDVKRLWVEVERWMAHDMKCPPLHPAFEVELHVVASIDFLRVSSTPYPWGWDMVQRVVEDYMSIHTQLAEAVFDNICKFGEGTMPDGVRRRLRALMLSPRGPLPQEWPLKRLSFVGLSNE